MTFGIETTAHRITLLSMHCLTACLNVRKMITCTRRRLCYPVSNGFYTKCHAFHMTNDIIHATKQQTSIISSVWKNTVVV